MLSYQYRDPYYNHLIFKHGNPYTLERRSLYILRWAPDLTVGIWCIRVGRQHTVGPIGRIGNLLLACIDLYFLLCMTLFCIVVSTGFTKVLFKQYNKIARCLIYAVVVTCAAGAGMSSASWAWHQGIQSHRQVTRWSAASRWRSHDQLVYKPLVTLHWAVTDAERPRRERSQGRKTAHTQYASCGST